MLDGILKEQELKEKMARLVELDALFSLDERGVEEKQELNQKMQKSSDKEEKKQVDRVEKEKEEKRAKHTW